MMETENDARDRTEDNPSGTSLLFVNVGNTGLARKCDTDCFRFSKGGSNRFQEDITGGTSLLFDNVGNTGLTRKCNSACFRFSKGGENLTNRRENDARDSANNARDRTDDNAGGTSLLFVNVGNSGLTRKCNSACFRFSKGGENLTFDHLRNIEVAKLTTKYVNSSFFNSCANVYLTFMNRVDSTLTDSRLADSSKFRYKYNWVAYETLKRNLSVIQGIRETNNDCNDLRNRAQAVELLGI